MAARIDLASDSGLLLSTLEVRPSGTLATDLSLTEGVDQDGIARWRIPTADLDVGSYELTIVAGTERLEIAEPLFVVTSSELDELALLGSPSGRTEPLEARELRRYIRGQVEDVVIPVTRLSGLEAGADTVNAILQWDVANDLIVRKPANFLRSVDEILAIVRLLLVDGATHVSIVAKTDELNLTFRVNAKPRTSTEIPEIRVTTKAPGSYQEMFDFGDPALIELTASTPIRYFHRHAARRRETQTRNAASASPAFRRRGRGHGPVTDPIADLLTRIRNATMARHNTVEVPASKVKREILHILEEEGFIRGFDVVPQAPQAVLRVSLKYGPNKEKVISGLQRVSRPGLRVYSKRADIPHFLGSFGVVIVSTSRGMMSGKRAKREGYGGEVVAHVW